MQLIAHVLPINFTLQWKGVQKQSSEYLKTYAESNMNSKAVLRKLKLGNLMNMEKYLTQVTSFCDFEMVPILFRDFHTRGYLGRGPLASHT